jgi:hypothetical protein
MSSWAESVENCGTHVVFLLQVHSFPVLIHPQLLLLRHALHLCTLIVVPCLREAFQGVRAEDDEADEWESKIHERSTLKTCFDRSLERSWVQRLGSKDGHCDTIESELVIVRHGLRSTPEDLDAIEAD